MRVIYDVVRDGLFAINTASSQLARAQQQLSSGKRISGAGDDPRGTQQAIAERSTLNGIDAYTKTNDAAAARLASADSVLTGYSDKLTSAITTALSAQGTQVNPAALASSAQALRSLRQAMVSDLNTTSNGNFLFSGTNSNAAAYAQVAGTWTYQGNADTAQVEVESGRTVSVSFNGRAIAQGSDTTDVFTALDTLATAVENGDNASIATGIDALQRAFDRAQRAQALLGTDEQGVDSAQIRLASLRTAAESRRSKLEDANLAQAATNLQKADTAYRAALGAVSSAERQSLLDYLR
ncbi:MAG: flagellin [Acidobacteriota bacterium]